jgi:Rho-binding antiterminator
MISCANHDYIEIACMYRFELRLVLENGQVAHGKAFQTVLNENKEECLVLETKSGNKLIVLEQVVSIEAVTDNSHFGKVSFR